ncbi:MAG: tyrosine-type recombinase/integrase [Terriglobia bacterium]
MDASRHFLMDNAVQVYMRAGSPHWQCACSVAGRQRRATTKEESLARAKDVARDWYLGLMGKYRAGELKEGPTFREAAQRFVDEYEVITQGQRNPTHVLDYRRKIEIHLNPFLGNKVLSDITPGLVQEYRIHRMKAGSEKPNANGQALPAEGEQQRRIKTHHRPPARSTLHKEIICIRLVLKTAQRLGWLPYLPDLSAPYKTSGKIKHRAWFSPEEYKTFYEATRERAKNPKKERWRKASEDLHDYVLFMVNTGLRPDEVLRLEYRDVAIVTDEPTGERILEIEVRGKRGIGFCKSMPGAVLPFQRLKKRNDGQPTDRLFPNFQKELFNAILNELGMKTDRDGQPRTAYSLRHTYICMRLMEGADIYQIAKNCRTSVEMIETYYASHIKNTLDASAINVRKPKPPKKARTERT